ncbi:monooxygenase [Vararia minispora EC-137]|uniref:Monooxygenase n=1 Tax=Vararia minispora EC-137 TaxID=1314806 RepID=A0ACB8QB43_9AGAM|nr:monooxygenase [Vararia minispora EC-137]
MGYARAVEPNSSGIHVLVVGCGFAGLACAIESVRKGHTVTVLEKDDPIRTQAVSVPQVISFNINAGRFFARWGIHDKAYPLCGHATELTLHNHLGEVIAVQSYPQQIGDAHAYNGPRSDIHRILSARARELGVTIRLGCAVESYFEDSTRGVAGVVLRSGEHLEADIVVGADGVRSRARKLVLGYDDKPLPSGYAIYRTWFDTREVGLEKDPRTAFLAREEDVLHCWLGVSFSPVFSVARGADALPAVSADISESWSFPGDRDAVLKIVDGWDPVCTALLARAPAFVDWKLVYRAPLPTWLSPGARLVLLGDAAHPFLPTSIQGASQAVEDGVALAVALQLGGKDDVPGAARTWEHTRYKRVRYAQILGETTRNKWHSATLADRGEKMKLPTPEWLLNFDVERHTYEVFADVRARIAREGYRPPQLPEDECRTS